MALYLAGLPGLVALLDIGLVEPDKEHPVLTPDLLKEMYARQSADAVGDIDLTTKDMPSGPAIRVRRKQIEDRDPTGHGTVMEEVTHAVRPPGHDDAIVMTMTWTALHLGDKLAEMADAIAQTIRVAPA